MQEKKKVYLTEQERIDHFTMKIDNGNLIGSGYIKYPPQERRPQTNFNDGFGDRYHHFNRFHPRESGPRYPQRRAYGPRGWQGQYWNSYNEMERGRPPFPPHRGPPTRGYDSSRRPSNYARQYGPSWQQDYPRGDYKEVYNQRPSHWNQSHRQQPHWNSSWRGPPHGNKN